MRNMLLAVALVAAATTPATACFMHSPQPVQVWMDHIQVDITDQVAVKTYRCTFKNPNGQAIVGGTCYMELEPGARADNMTVTVDGVETPAEILGVDRANEVFTQILKDGGSPALLEYYGNQLIQTKVPKVAAGKSVTVTLRYTTVLKNQGGLVRLQMLNTNPKSLMQPLKSASVTVNIRSQVPIKNLYSPTHEIRVEEHPDWDVTATWHEDEYLPKHPFVLYYQTSEADLAASLIAHRELGEQGAFLLMLSPTVGNGSGQIREEEVLPKDIVFCVDTSGSMLQGGTIEQVRQALAYCVDHLRSGDRFNIVDFGTAVRAFRDGKLIEVNEASKTQAQNYIRELAARGGTAMNEALQMSLGLLTSQNPADNGRLKMIIFATDGLPTIGEREPQKILDAAAGKNTEGVRIFVFGQGYNINTQLLDFLAFNHRGESEYILPEEKVDTKIASFFDRVGAPMMTDLELEFDGIEVQDVFPKSIKDVYRGEQILVYGRYTGHGERSVRLTGNVGSQRKSFNYKLTFPEVSTDDRNSFVPRLWAGRKVDALLNEIRRRDDEPQELIEEVTFLAKRYGIVTPYTSFLMVEDLVNAPPPMQVTSFITRMRSEKGGLKNDVVGRAAVVNVKQQAQSRGELARNGNAGNLYKQVEFGCAKEGRQVHAFSALRYVGNRCFYCANNVWYDSQFDETQRAKVRNVDVGSDEYFRLVADHPRAAKFMAQGDVVLELKGQWFQFNARKGG